MLELVARLLAARWTSDPIGRAERLDQAGRRLAASLRRIGGAYLKLGQAISPRDDLLPTVFLAPLRELQDHVADDDEPPPSELLARFAAVEAAPVASGTIARVYRASTHDGRLVAIKLRRREVVAQFTSDVALMSVAARALARLPGMRHLPIVPATLDLTSALLRQVDFAAEANAHRRFQAAIAAGGCARAPELLEELGDAGLLVTEWVSDAHPLSSPNLPPEERRRAAIASVRVLYDLIFLHGLVHCDLHPGNLLWRSPSELFVLDFGFWAELEPGHRRVFAEFFLSIVLQDGAGATRILLDTAEIVPQVLDITRLEDDVSALLHGVAGASAGEFLVAPFVAELFAVMRKHGVLGSPAFTMAMLALAMVEGILRPLHPQLDFQREALPYLLRAH